MTAGLGQAVYFRTPQSVELNKQLAEIEPEPLRRLYRHWLGMAGSGELPHARDFRPRQLGDDLMGHVAMTEIELVPFRVLYRYLGQDLVALYGENLTGRYVNDLFSESVRRKALDSYQQVVDTKRPLYSRRVFNLWFKKLGYYRLMLPFAWKTSGVDLVAVAIYPMQTYLRRAEQWRSMPEAEAFFAELSGESVPGQPSGTPGQAGEAD